MIKKYSYILFILFIISIFFPYAAIAEAKERLVVMQVQGLPSSEKSIYRSAIVKSLREKYIVLSGDQVDAKVKEIFEKESRESLLCDTEKCFQDIAVAFQAELIATCIILKMSSGYMLNLQVNNIIENRSVLAESEPCKGCDEFEIIGVLKAMAGVKPSAPAVAEERRKLEKEKEQKKTASLLQRNPGSLSGSRRSSDGRFIDHGDGTITDTTTNLMWTKKDSYADTKFCMDYTISTNYVNRLKTGGHSDWRMPTVRELEGLYEESKSKFKDEVANWYWSSEKVGSSLARKVSFDPFAWIQGDDEYCNGRGMRAVRR